MKRLFIIVACVSVLAACNPNRQGGASHSVELKRDLPRTDDGRSPSIEYGAWAKGWKDPQTGCEYISRSALYSSWTPRIDRDGVTHKGCGDTS